MKESIKLAAAIVGTAITGRPPVTVSRKVLPMRAAFKANEMLRFTTRLVYDAAGRCIEEVKVISGRLPPDGPRFFLSCQAEVKIGQHKRIVAIGDPIQANTLEEAFANHDATLKASFEKAQKDADAQVDKFMTEKAEAEAKAKEQEAPK